MCNLQCKRSYRRAALQALQRALWRLARRRKQHRERQRRRAASSRRRRRTSKRRRACSLPCVAPRLCPAPSPSRPARFFPPRSRSLCVACTCPPLISALSRPCVRYRRRRADRLSCAARGHDTGPGPRRVRPVLLRCRRRAAAAAGAGAPAAAATAGRRGASSSGWRGRRGKYRGGAWRGREGRWDVGAGGGAGLGDVL